MLADSFKGKPLTSLPNSALKAPVVAIAEVDNARDLGDRLEHLKRTLTRGQTGQRLLIVAVRF